ncbi:uracil-DNA glycosylase family protein [Leptospira weilii]|uniref:uracil-DNA glycosylase family protein n=1 Tax=Leptospira weilii TaxID=28184 RepID=UPI000A2F1A04|nr:uracil-DNA glycosylase family protein [Leptospira weilii]MCL8266003.1 uracil-DNA glycosylase [Leptospira weilii]MDL5244222.1 uracil-DNA glycosylase family protein [Leptospira weilii]QDK23944.1 uracil-DNA glycosylase [Leptospira weilii]QDK27907.1 uracil-DNA glycosylase [Leptospira weilii]ULH29522.1 uracil-DNA glycosylase [Leptospira weilii]
MKSSKLEYSNHIHRLLSCRKCPKMQGNPVHGCIPSSRIISLGQAPGIHEERFGKPFAYTAGKTLFGWFKKIGIDEETFRSKVNMSAVCRCFPGKAKSGDRKPDLEEVKNCSEFLEFEVRFHKPELLIPIGKLAIDQLFEFGKYKLEDVIGKTFSREFYGVRLDWIPLPHPSGLNVWNHTETGKKLIREALDILKNHPVIREEFSI